MLEEYGLYQIGCGHAYWWGEAPCQIPLFCGACMGDYSFLVGTISAKD